MRCPVTRRNQHGEEVFSVCFDKNALAFRPGQYIMAGPAGLGHLREYSLASAGESGEGRILFRKIPEGLVSPALAELQEGDFLDVRGPFGEFVLPENFRQRKFLFAATGTGIAPFSSFVSSHTASGEDLDYTLLHGVRYMAEDYLHGEFQQERLVSCISREIPSNGGFCGRITDYFQSRLDRMKEFDFIYACGNSDMIYELFALARKAGFLREQLRAEIYF
ncbi:FAD-binding oxidoreductase [Marispirochaeta sp.]|uniref:ferredoxin--NADP reductase n=1 Tax=Marispirochaeta sp. TaxID=2038653 RepID=UPI0029C8D40B|nr:FAD-binding oxidoreductase [Marispirochaeta sp.]